MNISNIDWPNNSKDSVVLYLDFLLKVIRDKKIELPKQIVDFDTIEITEKYINGDISSETYHLYANFWWKYLDDNEKLRDFSNHDALSARIAICLLSATEEDADKLGEHLAWFFELMDYLGVNIDDLLKDMRKHFSFKS